MRLGALLVTVLAAAGLAAAPAAAAPTDADCAAIPCPPFPPHIYVDLGEADEDPIQLHEDDLPVEIEGTVTWRYDVDRYALFAWEPHDPPTVQLGFEFVPEWLSPTVEPASYPVQMSPEHVQADGSDPSDPQIHYVHRQDVTVRLEAVDEPTPPDDQDRWHPGLSASSTQSGSFSAAFGYQGIAIQPAGSGMEQGSISAGTLPGFEAVVAIAVVVGAAVVVRRGRH